MAHFAFDYQPDHNFIERAAVLEQYTHHRYQQLMSPDIPADLTHHTRIADHHQASARLLGATDQQISAADRDAHDQAYRTMTDCRSTECSCHRYAADYRTAAGATG